MIDLEIFGTDVAAASGGSSSRGARRIPPLAEMRRLSILAAAAGGVHDGHLAIEFVDAERISALNREFRGRTAATDVLSFPIDGAGPVAGAASHGSAAGPSARELGDVVICIEHTVDVAEAIVHGVLHLVGMDHERDDGEMLARQRELLERDPA